MLVPGLGLGLETVLVRALLGLVHWVSCPAVVRDDKQHTASDVDFLARRWRLRVGFAGAG